MNARQLNQVLHIQKPLARLMNYAETRCQFYHVNVVILFAKLPFFSSISLIDSLYVSHLYHQEKFPIIVC